MCILVGKKNKKGNEIASLLGILEESDLMRFDENLDCSPPGKNDYFLTFVVVNFVQLTKSYFLELFLL